MARDRLHPEVIGLTATSLDAWRRCPRLYLDRYLLGVPASDTGPSPDFGTFVHALLHRIHATGSCADTAHVRDVLESHGADDGVIPTMVSRHAARCPSRHATRARHEHELARFHRGAPQFLAAGRLDAIWQLDDVLEVRDYKTGARATERVADDPRARLQAWIAAPTAERLGLRLRVRYEHLAAEVDDEPDPFEPEADDLDAITEELCAAVAAIRDAGADVTGAGFAGVRDPAICDRCDFRSVCPDSATPGVPTWPEPPDLDEA
jgi:hypothetical protein